VAVEADSSSPDLNDRALHRRAVEAVIWGMPLVNYQLMYEAARRAGGPGDNQIVYWPGLLDSTNQTLTPNPDLIYAMPFFNTMDAGPIVLEVPAAGERGALNGSIMNRWQVAIEDIGPAGVDAGQGGRFLILPPDHSDPIPPGYTPLPSDSFQGYGLVRSLLRGGSDADIGQAVAYAREIKLYPLSRADYPPETAWVDASGAPFDAAIPYDLRFFELLDRAIQAEPFLHRDRVMINQLRSIGIQTGQAFQPDASAKQLLIDAAEEARSWLDGQLQAIVQPVGSKTRWALPALPELIKSSEANFELPDAYPIDARGVTYSFAFFSSKHLGKGQYYLMTLVDGQDQPLSGANQYILNVPADAPVTQYWSATAYNRDTHTLIAGMERASRGSQSPGLRANPDRSVDLYFGPTPPHGWKDNWIPTDPEGSFEVIFRFYGPTAPLFDHSWQLNDIQRRD
jgi:hypothetical protein